jgi:hypothetical protein
MVRGWNRLQTHCKCENPGFGLRGLNSSLNASSGLYRPHFRFARGSLGNMFAGPASEPAILLCG